MEFKKEAVALILEQGYSVAEAANPLGIGER
jgi:transposase-like protein